MQYLLPCATMPARGTHGRLSLGPNWVVRGAFERGGRALNASKTHFVTSSASTSPISEVGSQVSCGGELGNGGLADFRTIHVVEGTVISATAECNVLPNKVIRYLTVLY